MAKKWAPILELAEDVRSGKVSALEQVKKSLRLIDEHSEFNAVISKIEKRAIERAKEVDAKIQEGADPGRLAGVPFIAKDNFLVFGAETTAASNILKGFDAPYQSTAIEKLESEGAICVAKANLDAFAHGASTENSDFFTTKNPHDNTRVAGGSSGGSAAAVALSLAPFALGTDTGGSIRQPASFCGAVGLKPTYGLVSRSGVVAMASSTDVVGPITNSVDDAALVLDVIAGQDALDGTTIPRQESYLTPNSTFNLQNTKIGIIKEYFGDGLDPDVRNKIELAIEDLKKAGADVVEVSLPSLALALAVYYIVCPAEVSSNLARYDGQRFGYSFKDSKNLDESYEVSREQGFGNEAKRRIMIGTYVLSSGYYDAYYKKAQTVRTKLTNEFNEIFTKVDFLIGPTAPTTAFKIGENTQDPLAMYLGDIMTVGASMVGVPAISIPCGDISGLPVGLQIIAPQKQDRELLEIAKWCEEANR
ncbi:Asp-tRNA(Asn)/Glu-tRNA(Gln) amidotransferase subunit GatA [Candidatus Saccharibacteria bacterium]|nr:Asp-tRNA(Asn)/Glu-tRNA(Gln) amidotransferase subunit GatA [Candidatus Saccharibacteria bacterium]